MNLSKTYIRMPVYKNNASVQMTLDSDFNVPDMKPDIERLIQEKGTLHIRDIKPSKDKCIIRGELAFGVLYMGDDGSFTMYIDLVKEEFAKNSTSVDRYNLNDYKSIEEIFNKIKN